MRRVLLVEDDESNRLTLAALLEDEGFVVDEAASFAEARERIAGAGEPYAVVLLDRSLPDGHGPDLAPQVRDRMPAALLVALSGHDGAAEGWEDGRVVKGSDPALLRRILAEPAGGARP